LGGVLVFALLLTAFLLARRKIINSRIQNYGLLLMFVSYFVYLMALFFTFSRAAWLTFFIGLIFLAVAIMRKEDRWVKGRFLVLIFFSILLFVLAAFPYKDLVNTRLFVESRLEQISLTERTNQIFSAKDVIKKHPLFGVGAGNYVNYVEKESEVKNDFTQPVHNSYLLLWAETGLFSLLSLLLFIYFLIREGRRQTFSLAAIVALLLLMFFEHWFFSLPFGIIFFFFILGVI
jgi:O-antigen ligase